MLSPDTRGSHKGNPHAQGSVNVNYCVSHRTSTQQVPEVCNVLVTTRPSVLCTLRHPLLSIPPGILELLSILSCPSDLRPFLPLPLHSPSRFPLSSLKDLHPEASPERFYLEKTFLYPCCGLHQLPSLPPTLTSQAECTFCVALGPTCWCLTGWGGASPADRSCLRAGGLLPSPRRLLAWHSNAGSTCDMYVLCVCPRRNSCQRGWRLLYIIAAYHSCSQVLQPYLVRFLRDVSQTPGLPFQGEGPASGDLRLWAFLHGQPAGGETSFKDAQTMFININSLSKYSWRSHQG